MAENLIKSITSHTCPHCEEEIFVESQMIPPSVNALFTKEDVENAKEDCKARIETLAIDDEKKASILKWIDDPATVFGPAEVENIMLSILNPEK